MSYEPDETYDVYNETYRTARKAHTCCACRRTIQPGHRYCDVRTVFEGTVSQYRRCGACQLTHLHLRELGEGVFWPDEQLGCGESYESEWGGPPPEEIARLPLLSDDEAGALLEGRA